LVIDQGTQATRAFAFDREGRVQASTSYRISLHRLGADMIEEEFLSHPITAQAARYRHFLDLLLATID
jgi:sugar (pentulose or hexulose) kinase